MIAIALLLIAWGNFFALLLYHLRAAYVFYATLSRVPPPDLHKDLYCAVVLNLVALISCCAALFSRRSRLAVGVAILLFIYWVAFDARMLYFFMQVGGVLIR